MNCIDHRHGTSLGRLFAALGVMFAYFIVQTAVSYASGSLALRADALHMLVHCSVILVGIVCVLAARKQYRHSQTLDYLGGALNGLLLVGMAAMILLHGLNHSGHGGHDVAVMAQDMCSSSAAVTDHSHHGHHGHHGHHTPAPHAPHGPSGTVLMIMALAGVLVHGFCAWLVSNGKQFLCTRGIYVNMLGHTGVSAMIFITGLAMTIWNVPSLDKWAGLLMATIMGFLGLRQFYVSLKPFFTK